MKRVDVTFVHVLLYHMAALHLYNFVLMFLYRCRCFACSALQKKISRDT